MQQWRETQRIYVRSEDGRRRTAIQEMMFAISSSDPEGRFPALNSARWRLDDGTQLITKNDRDFTDPSSGRRYVLAD